MALIKVTVTNDPLFLDLDLRHELGFEVNEFDFEVDDGITIQNLIILLVEKGIIMAIISEKQFYDFAIKGKRHFFLEGVEIFSEKRDSPDSPTLASLGVVAGDRIGIEIMEYTSAGIDVLTLTATIASVVQVGLMIVDMWSRKAKKKKESAKLKRDRFWDKDKSQHEVKEISLLMSDGKKVKFESWVDEPSKVRTFIEVLNQSSESPKPIRMTLLLKNGSQVNLSVSDKQESKQQIAKLIEYLEL